MTTLLEKARAISTELKQVKIDWVAAHPEQTDIPVHLHLYRDNDLVIVTRGPVDRDIALQAAHVGTLGTSATATALSVESWHSELKESPITHEPWAHHEMQYIGETYPEAWDRKWVAECINTTIWDREMAAAMVMLPYRIKDKKLEFGEEHEFSTDDELKGDGYMFDVMRQIMDAEPVLANALRNNATARELMELLDEEARNFHMDAACLQAMHERKVIIDGELKARPHSERAKWIKERYQ